MSENKDNKSYVIYIPEIDSYSYGSNNNINYNNNMSDNKEYQKFVIYISEIDSYMQEIDNGYKFVSDVNKATILNSIAMVQDYLEEYNFFNYERKDIRILAIEIIPNHLKDYFPDDWDDIGKPVKKKRKKKKTGRTTKSPHNITQQPNVGDIWEYKKGETVNKNFKCNNTKEL